MNRLLGYSLMSVGLLGFLFFLKYNGTTISVKELWFVLSIITVIAGGYLLAKYKFKKLNNQPNDSSSDRLTEIGRLKRIGEKVRVTLDSAEIKTTRYRQEIIKQSLLSRTEIIDSFYDDNRNYRTVEVQQTYIIFYKEFSGMKHKFVSQVTTQSADAVKMYLHPQKGVDLYIDSTNPANYYFDLNF